MFTSKPVVKSQEQVSQSVDFLVGCSGSADKSSLEFSFLFLSKLGHNPKTQFTDLIHGLLGILAAQELDIAECLGQTNLRRVVSRGSGDSRTKTDQFSLREPVLVVLHELLLELPVVLGFVWRTVLLHVPGLTVSHLKYNTSLATSSQCL